MTKRILLLVAMTVVLVVPAVSLADGGGGNAPTAAGQDGHHRAPLERLANRLDKRFRAFSSHCLVQNAPEQCAKVADHLVKRLDKLQGGLHKLEDMIKAKCGAANPPAKCSNSSQVIQKIDDLLGKIASEEAAIKAAFPNAGSA